jgi:hypothetical protein
MGRLGWGFHKKLPKIKNIFILYKIFKKCSQPQPKSPIAPLDTKAESFTL